MKKNSLAKILFTLATLLALAVTTYAESGLAG